MGMLLSDLGQHCLVFRALFFILTQMSEQIFMPKKLEGHNALARPSVRASQFFYVTVSFKQLKLGS